MDNDNILTTQQQGVLTIRLNRPARLNSFNEALHRQLRDALKLARRDQQIRCVLLTGNGRGFCAGQDLNDRKSGDSHDPPDLGQTLQDWYNPLILQITTLEKPVICAVNGVAAGAGASLALACDLVIAAKSASFILSFSRLGLVPDSAASWLLPRLIGHARAMGMALSAEKISAEQALAWGMIWQMVDDEALPDIALAQAQHFACQPTYGLGLIKKALYASAHNSLSQQLDLERDLQRLAGRSEDYREGVQAFLDKRSAQFKGC